MDCFEEHFDEASFLWQQRERALASPLYTREDVAALESRLRRHVDGMVLAGAGVAKDLLLPFLEADEPEQGAVATLVLLDEDVQLQDEVLAALRAVGLPQRVAICQALETRPRHELEGHLLRMLETGSSEVQGLLLDVLSSWDALPAPVVAQHLTSSFPRTRAAALRALRGPPSQATRAVIVDCLSSKNADVLEAALIAGLKLGIDAAWPACRQYATSQGPVSGTARLLFALCGEAREQALLIKALRIPGPAIGSRQTLRALGVCGTPEAAEACLALMSSPQHLLARVAGEAFSAITGLLLKGSFIANGDTTEPETEEEALLPELELPLPEVDAVTVWWHQHRRRFSAYVRYLEGEPFSPERLLSLYNSKGSMRRRSALALELVLRSRGAWEPASRAFMDVQEQRLEQALAQTTLFRKEPLGRLMHTPAPRHVVQPPYRPGPQTTPAPIPPNAVVITGMGMVSPLALGAVPSCAAARAGLMRAAELEGCEVLDPANGESYPVRGHAIAHLTQGFNGLGRLARLGEAALRELREFAQASRARRTGLYVALPSQALARTYARWLADQARDTEEEEEEPNPPDDIPPEALAPGRLQPEQHLLPLLARLSGLHTPRDQQRAFPNDALGFLSALVEATRAIEQGRMDLCIVGGIDSLVEPWKLRALKALGLLKVPHQPARPLPGEAAAFLVLERNRDALRRGSRALAICGGIHAPGPGSGGWGGSARAGRALAESLSTTLSHAEAPGERVGRVIGALNGYDRRAYAWGHALATLAPHTALGQLPLWSPAESFGELGAATGPVATCMALRDFARGVTASPQALVWLMEDDGGVGSFLVKATLRERLPSGERT